MASINVQTIPHIEKNKINLDYIYLKIIYMNTTGHTVHYFNMR